MPRISDQVKTILQQLDDTYASKTYKQFYGASPYRNWQVMFDRLLQSIGNDSSKFGLGLTYYSEWGEIIFSRIKTKNRIYTIITYFRPYMNVLDDWFTNAIYPPSAITFNRPQTFNSFSYVKPLRKTILTNGVQVYAVQSDTHLYSLADKNKKLVLDKWFDTLKFPMEQSVGNLHIIGYGTINKIPYYIDDNLALHHGAEIAHLQKPKIEGKQYKKNVIRLTESQFHKMLVECISKIMKKIV